MIFRKRYTRHKLALAYKVSTLAALARTSRRTRMRRARAAPPDAAAGADTRRKLKMCINYEDYMKKRNVLHLILLHTITYGLGTALT